MKKNSVFHKIVAAALAVSLLTCLLTGCGKKAEDAPAADIPAETASEPLTATGDTLQKDETVYVLCGADGDVDRIIVSDWLKNGTEENAISDATNLTDLTVTKGDTSYTMDAKNMTVWDAKGGDVRYQGESTDALPVSVSVSYKLDGKSISAEELAGKSGKVTIRFDYKNNAATMATVGGAKQKIYVPFVMLTGVVLDRDVFSNVTVTNGKTVQMDAQTAVMGFAMPGLQEDLGIAKSDLELPDYVEITADAENFTMGSTMTMASAEAVGDIDLSQVKSADDLKKSMSDLTDGMQKLMDGSSDLYDGLGLLLEKSNTLVTAIGQMKDATKKLKDGGSELYNGSVSLRDNLSELKKGLDTLTANNDTLNGGAKTVFDTLIASANTQLKAAGLEQLGLTVPTLTIENYSKVLTDLISALGAESVYATAHAAALKQVTAAVDAKSEEITAAVTEAVRAQVAAKVQENAETVYLAAAQAGVRGKVLATGATAEQADAYLATDEGKAAVAAAAAGLTDAQKQAAITAAVGSQMSSDAGKKILEDAIAAQRQKTIDEQMASDAVTAKIAEATAAASAGAAKLVTAKGQLDQYNVFYKGLADYTKGVSDAATAAGKLYGGSQTLASSMKTLSDGLDTLDSSVKELKDGASKLPDGVTELKDGAMQLSDGLTKLNDEGIGKLTSLVGDDLAGFLDRAQATIDAAKSYQNFSGLSDGMDGSVRFVYKTAEVK